MADGRWVAGILLAGVLHASAPGALAAAEAGARVDLDERTFCESRLQGELWARTELYFGLSRAGGSDISEEEFQHFVDTVVTPRFPDGLTLLSGTGQFRGASGVIVAEGTKLLILFYPWSQSRSRAADRIRTLYKEGFQQEAVLRVDEQSCVSF